MEIINAASPSHGQQLTKLGEFLGLKSIAYKDLGNGEDYVFTRKDGQKITLRVRGNQDQGGFLVIP
ncbi:MAG: hypothetical protein WC242_00680 [Candidatus Paceibacterota bacterium]|jgi:hypothetical protein